MTARTLERRTGKAQAIELRAGAEGSPGTLRGYAIVYNSLSQNLGGFVEQVAPGAADKSIADGVRVLARYNHDDNFLLGATDSGTVRLSSDGTGVLYEVDLPNTSAGRDVAELARRGDLRNSSFAFYTIDDDWGFTEQDFPVRTLRAVQLVDVAPVNTPAYLDTTAAVRSLAVAADLDPARIDAEHIDEIRAALRGDAPPEPEQVDNHSEPGAVPLTIRQRQSILLDIEADSPLL